MSEQNYWIEHAEIAMDEAGLEATPDQIDTIAGVIESAHQFYGQSMGHDVASANLRAEREREKEKLEADLERERNKVVCRRCNGYGYTVLSYGTRSGELECPKCDGRGRHDP